MKTRLMRGKNNSFRCTVFSEPDENDDVRPLEVIFRDQTVILTGVEATWTRGIKMMQVLSPRVGIGWVEQMSANTSLVEVV